MSPGVQGNPYPKRIYLFGFGYFWGEAKLGCKNKSSRLLYWQSSPKLGGRRPHSFQVVRASYPHCPLRFTLEGEVDRNILHCFFGLQCFFLYLLHVNLQDTERRLTSYSYCVFGLACSQKRSLHPKAAVCRVGILLSPNQFCR